MSGWLYLSHLRRPHGLRICLNAAMCQTFPADAPGIRLLLMPARRLRTMKTEASVTDGILHVRSVMLDVSVPLSSVTAVEMRHGRPKLLPNFSSGYHGIYCRSGRIFLNDYGNVYVSCDERLPALIVLRYEGEIGILAFNLKTLYDTQMIFDEIVKGCRRDVETTVRRSTPEEVRASARSTRHNLAEMRGVAVAVIGIAIVVLMLKKTFFRGASVGPTAIYKSPFWEPAW